MMSKSRLLIIQPQPFGELTDSYKWCEYLREEYNITVLCQYSKNIVSARLQGVRVYGIKSIGNRLLRGAIFAAACLLNLLFFHGKIIVVHFEHCEIFKYFFPKKKMILDIRTLSINKDSNVRTMQNRQIKKACSKFDIVTIISEGTKRQLGLSSNNVYILPLGADCISEIPKSYDTLHLLYVGTFAGRDIDKTIIGIDIFKRQHSDIPITYDIIGSGFNNEVAQYKQLVKELHLEDSITIHGRIAHTALKPFFDKCNVGVSFIPITEYYDDQPPTKTFEYMFSGLYTIATGTRENVKIINNSNGVIIQDTPEAFSEAIYKLYLNRFELKDKIIRSSLQEFSWSDIIENKLKLVLNQSI